MKKLSKIIFIFVLSFLFLSHISAKNYKVSCDYYGTDNNEYVIKFEMIGDSIKIIESTKSGNAYSIFLETDDWNRGKDCPSTLSLYDGDNGKYAKITSDSSTTRLFHYWSWDCTYKINEDGSGEKINSLTLKYYLADGTQEVKSKDTAKFTYDNGVQPVKYFILKYGNVTFLNYGHKCIPISISYSGSTATITFSDDGKYIGKKNSFSYNKEVIETTASSCLDYKTNSSLCRTDSDVACLWVENEASPNNGYCNVDNLLYVGCGGASDIPMQVPSIISMAVNLLKIATPIILIFISITTLVKAMAAQKDDEIKKATSSLIKKIIAGALVFFVVAIVQFIVSVVANDDAEYKGFENCLNCFLNNKCDTNTYYKTVVGGEDLCTTLTTGQTDSCSNLFDTN